MLAELLPLHYFEKAPVVRIIWELWISMRTTLSSVNPSSNPSLVIESFVLKEISIEFTQRMILLASGLLKISRDPSDYPIHKAVFDGTLESIVDLSFKDKATLTSLMLFGQEVDPNGNTPLKLAVRIGDYDSVRVLLKSGCS